MNRLQEIFDKQTLLLASLQPVYLANSFEDKVGIPPYPLNDRHSQEQFRLLAWRTVEEVYEAIDCWENRLGGKTLDDYREEAADVLHFFIELCICSGVTGGEICSGMQGFEDTGEDFLEMIFDQVRGQPVRTRGNQGWLVFIAAVAQVMMDFRQRPWRTDDRPTDRGKLVQHLSVAWFSFVNACISTGISDKSLYEAYFKKNKINDQRVIDAKANIIEAELADDTNFALGK